MDDGSPQAARTLIAGVEYRFVEKLASATVDGEVVVCGVTGGAQRSQTVIGLDYVAGGQGLAGGLHLPLDVIGVF